jgi:nitrous oxidase accessory protein NosD
MLTYDFRHAPLVAVLPLVFVCSISTRAFPQVPPIYVPACGADPNANTRALQDAIDHAPTGATLILPPGDCVVAKCDLARGSICYGANGHPHRSALNIGARTALTLAGASDGTSLLKLDPNPPRDANGYHAYCGDTHVILINGSSFIGLRGFTIDGSDGELPEDANQCPVGGSHDGTIAERMFDVYVLNSSDVTIDGMNLTKAHGDGLNLAAQRGETSIPATERVAVRKTRFIDNDRSGIAFQRNVGYVTISGNYFKGSGKDQDLDMEPSGGADDLGPYQIDIDHNDFDRLTVESGIAVTLGSAGGTQRSNGIRFTYNTIRARAAGRGGCIFVYHADNTTIAHNTVVGGSNCVTISAQKVTGLSIENNDLRSYANMHTSAGFFTPSPVISIVQRVVNQGDTAVCGASPKPPCPYYIYYPDRITIVGNKIVQNVQASPGIALNNPDVLQIADNQIVNTDQIAPAYPIDTRYPAPRDQSVTVLFGLQNLPSYGYYMNERTAFRGWSLTGNLLYQFDDGIRLAPIKDGVTLAAAEIRGNTFSTLHEMPVGIWLAGAPTSPQSAFIKDLTVDANQFACGFPRPVLGPLLPRNAFLKPLNQAFTGTIGSTAPCPPPPIVKF